MINTFIIILTLVVVVAGCGGFRSASDGAKSSPTPVSTPAQPKKVVDLPALLGKSRDEMVKIVGKEPKRESAGLYIDWDVELGTVHVNYDIKKVPTRYNFSFQTQAVGSQLLMGTETPDQLAGMAGIDLQGKTPTGTGMYPTIEGLTINGKTVKVVFGTVREKYNSVTIELEPTPK